MNSTFSRFCIHRAESPIVAASGCPSTSFSPVPSAAVSRFRASKILRLGLVLAAAIVQLYNFSAVWRCAFGGNKIAPYVAASMVYLVLAASLGALLGFNKILASETSLLPGRFTSNLFAHIHLAGIGWVTTMIFGFQLTLVPTTCGKESLLPIRFWLLQAGILGLAVTFLADLPWQATFATVLLVVISWQAWGPVRAFVTGRAREWEVVPLVLLVAIAVTGVLLAFGIPAPENPASYAGATRIRLRGASRLDRPYHHHRCVQALSDLGLARAFPARFRQDRGAGGEGSLQPSTSRFV